ncbi:NAD dependent epimerase/dehydratase family protein [Alkalibacterium putridalgicola]|jgi:uronate dehydrogenase|uniref:NAD dependent epimerase/dehydratase family protein n=1 Tax=Alkalibacterium putridalgicola TaxID=426703 RepID=A0A1H7UX45_9LACT|nr:NAD(P)-dependent oxidoreductase [Alkalibacterium putridalgicola]GEK89544.1 NAD-dependent epimerase [Alkalibacterium putridalgicola]SEM01319.1 NAD dependent epimerase/dehydratase family protein [Alkalibacterium putridalgicola]
MSRILITGATGTIGTNLTRHLKGKHDLVLVDIDFSSFPEDLKQGVEIIKDDLIELEAWDGLLDDVEYVIQLAANPDPDADFYDELVGLNYVLPQNLYKKAMDASKLKRIIFASSIHASDAYPDNVQVKTTDQPRPDDLYGVSKVYIEALASYYAFNKGIESIGIRIGDYKSDDSELDPDSDFNGMAMYFSARDMNHLIDRCLEAELLEPYLLVNGISNNTFPRLDIHSAKVKLGYEPQDNAFEKLNKL